MKNRRQIREKIGTVKYAIDVIQKFRNDKDVSKLSADEQQLLKRLHIDQETYPSDVIEKQEELKGVLTGLNWVIAKW